MLYVIDFPVFYIFMLIHDLYVGSDILCSPFELTLPQRRSGVRNVLVSAYEKTTSFPGS
jgi:hypothetical protein